MWDSNISLFTSNSLLLFHLNLQNFLFIVVLWSIRMASNCQEKQLSDFNAAGAIPQKLCGNCHFHPSNGYRAQANSSAAVLVIIFLGIQSRIVQLFWGWTGWYFTLKKWLIVVLDNVNCYCICSYCIWQCTSQLLLWAIDTTEHH